MSDSDNNLIPMSDKDLNELMQYNGGRPITDRETQQQLMDLRNKSYTQNSPMVVNPEGYNAGLYQIPAVGQESYLRNASVPVGNVGVFTQPGQQPSDLDILKAQQASIADKQDFNAKLQALKMLQGK